MCETYAVLVECIGYTARVVSIHQPENIQAYLTSYVSILYVSHPEPFVSLTRLTR